MTAKGYGEFPCDVFDVYGERCGAHIRNRCSTRRWFRGAACPGVRSMGETCGDALPGRTHNGDVYSCDHFVYPEYKLGNIAETC